MWVLLRHILGNLAFKGHLRGSSRKVIERTREILIFKTVLKMYYRLSLKYIIVDNIVRDFRAELGVEDYCRTGNSSNLSILLSKKARKVALNQAKKTTKRAIEV